MRMKRGEYGAAPECEGEGGGRPRANPPPSGIVRHDSHMRKSVGDPAGSRTRGRRLRQTNTQRVLARHGICNELPGLRRWLYHPRGRVAPSESRLSCWQGGHTPGGTRARVWTAGLPYHTRTNPLVPAALAEAYTRGGLGGLWGIQPQPINYLVKVYGLNASSTTRSIETEKVAPRRTGEGVGHILYLKTMITFAWSDFRKSSKTRRNDNSSVPVQRTGGSCVCRLMWNMTKGDDSPKSPVETVLVRRRLENVRIASGCMPLPLQVPLHFIPALLHTHLTSPSSALKTSQRTAYRLTYNQTYSNTYALPGIRTESLQNPMRTNRLRHRRSAKTLMTACVPLYIMLSDKSMYPGRYTNINWLDEITSYSYGRAVHTRRTQQGPVTKEEPGETECILRPLMRDRRGTHCIRAAKSTALADGGSRRSPRKTHRPAASSGTIPSCENPGVARPGIEPGSLCPRLFFRVHATRNQYYPSNKTSVLAEHHVRVDSLSSVQYALNGRCYVSEALRSSHFSKNAPSLPNTHEPSCFSMRRNNTVTAYRIDEKKSTRTWCFVGILYFHAADWRRLTTASNVQLTDETRRRNEYAPTQHGSNIDVCGVKGSAARLFRITHLPSGCKIVSETLPPGHDKGWLTWKSLNRLRSGVGRSKKVNLARSCYAKDDNINCDCEEDQTVQHMLQCRLCPLSCMEDDLNQASENAFEVAKWQSCRTIPFVGGFSQGFPVSPTHSFRRRSIFTSTTLIGSQGLATPQHHFPVTDQQIQYLKEPSSALASSFSAKCNTAVADIHVGARVRGRSRSADELLWTRPQCPRRSHTLRVVSVEQQSQHECLAYFPKERKKAYEITFLPGTYNVFRKHVYKLGHVIRDRKRILVETLNKRNNNLFCQLLRHSNWSTTLFEGKLEGRTIKGRPRVNFIDINKGKHTYFHLKLLAKQRKRLGDMRVTHQLKSSGGKEEDPVGTSLPRSRSEGAIRATLTRTPSASSLLRARRAVFPP
ncbi:hypothetical protein PR048_007814 [Dryococelus australis]|uniref:Uncharacterized protein n=1 Tax=Dryococelus australis TaxID=614101 RepID=A0ABQ9HVB3_9NEOP|nr:hypothetical protein PR048_007814 [Dryococelus australis]